LNPFPFLLAEWRTAPLAQAAVVLLVALAVGLGIAVSAQERALREGTAAAADAFDLVVGAPASETQLVLSTVYLQPTALELIDGRVLAELAAHPDVAYAAPLGFGDNWRGHPIVGSTAAFVTRGGRVAPAAGRVFERIDEVVVGADVPLAVGEGFVPVHGQVATGDDAAHEGLTYRVVGRMPRSGTPWDRAIVATIEAVWWVHALPVGHRLDAARVWPQGPAGPPDLAAVPIGPPWAAEELPGVPAVVVRPASFAAAYQLRQTYRSGATMAVFPAEVLVQLYALLGDVRDLVAAISLLTQVLVIGAVLLAVLASLAQRRRTLGVLRALGASRRFVFVTVWAGVATVLVAGAALGVVLGWMAAFAVGTIVAARTAVDLPVGLGASELALAGAIVAAGVALATVPALLAYRVPVSTALRA
jgi:putative ABC transport system permease protein